MKYIKEVESKNIADALMLTPDDEKRLKDVINKAYHQSWHEDGPNIDQINAFVAPFIKTPEEAFFVATIIITDVFGAMENLSASKFFKRFK